MELSNAVLLLMNDTKLHLTKKSLFKTIHGLLLTLIDNNQHLETMTFTSSPKIELICIVFSLAIQTVMFTGSVSAAYPLSMTQILYVDSGMLKSFGIISLPLLQLNVLNLLAKSVKFYVSTQPGGKVLVIIHLNCGYVRKST